MRLRLYTLFIVLLAAGTGLPIALAKKTKARKKAEYDEIHRLSHVFELTWKYFAEHPGTEEFTEVHSGKGIFQIFSKSTESKPEYEVLTIYPGDPDVYPRTFEGPGAEKAVESFLLNELKMNPDDIVTYQITGFGGPEVFFKSYEYEEEEYV